MTFVSCFLYAKGDKDTMANSRLCRLEGLAYITRMTDLLHEQPSD